MRPSDSMLELKSPDGPIIALESRASVGTQSLSRSHCRLVLGSESASMRVLAVGAPASPPAAPSAVGRIRALSRLLRSRLDQGSKRRRRECWLVVPLKEESGVG